MSGLIRELRYYVYGIWNGSGKEVSMFVYLENSKNIVTDLIGKNLNVTVKPKSLAFCFQAIVDDLNKGHILEVGMASQ